MKPLRLIKFPVKGGILIQKKSNHRKLPSIKVYQNFVLLKHCQIDLV